MYTWLSAMTLRDNYALFLDRDGVINANRPDYVKSIGEVVFLPSTAAAMQQLVGFKGPIYFVTNQAAVGYGIISLAKARIIQRFITAAVEQVGGPYIQALMCPHAPEDNCLCRKPGKILVERVIRERDIRGGWVIGDGPEDVELAWAVGLKPLLVLTGRGNQTALQYPAVEKHATILEAVMAVKEWLSVRDSITNAALAE